MWKALGSDTIQIKYCCPHTIFSSTKVKNIIYSGRFDIDGISRGKFINYLDTLYTQYDIGLLE